MDRQAWINNRQIEWQYVCRPYERIVMSIHYGILLGLRPWIAMPLIYAWVSFLSYLMGPHVSIISTVMLLLVFYALLDYILRVIGLQSISARLQSFLDTTKEEVIERTGRAPLEFEQICYVLAVFECRYLNIREALESVHRRNPSAFLGIVLSFYAVVSLITMFIISEHGIVYIIMVCPLLLPALHHYSIVPRLFRTMEPFAQSTAESARSYSYLEPYFAPAISAFGKMYASYKERVAIPEDFWDKTPDTSMARPASIIIDRSAAGSSSTSNAPFIPERKQSTADSLRDVVTAYEPRQNWSIFSASYWFGSENSRRLSTASIMSHVDVPSTLIESETVSKAAKPYAAPAIMNRKSTGSKNDRPLSTSINSGSVSPENGGGITGWLRGTSKDGEDSFDFVEKEEVKKSQ